MHKQLKDCPWPTYDPALTMIGEITIPIQVNGKLRGDITVSPQTDEATVRAKAEAVIFATWLQGKTIVKVIYIPNRMISFVVK